MRSPVACLVVLAGLAAACQERTASTQARVADLRREDERLQQRLDSLVAKDGLLSRPDTEGGDLVVAIRSGLLVGLIGEATQRYLDRVVLEMKPELRVQEEGEVKARTFLGNIKAGSWTLELTLHRVQGVLRARPPRLDVIGGNRVGIALPVALDAARWRATLGFAWDATAAASLVCGDFAFRRPIDGSVLPQEYPVAGSVLLSASTGALSAEPSFPERKFRIRVDLTPASWGEIRSFLESQDTLLKCGIAMNPEQILPRLRPSPTKGSSSSFPAPSSAGSSSLEACGRR